jgi:hypothetical protein
VTSDKEWQGGDIMWSFGGHLPHHRKNVEGGEYY